MTPLAETRRLTMDPSSNLPQAEDTSWVYLLSGTGAVACIGRPPPTALSALEQLGTRVMIVDEESEPASSVLDAVVIASGERGVVDAGLRRLEPVILPSTTFVQLPGSFAAASSDWLTLCSTRSGSRHGRRLSRVVELGVARTARMVRLPPPASARSHASDVGFVNVPADLTAEPDNTCVSVGCQGGGLPRYLVDLAGRAGFDYLDRAWSFGPPRGFPSQKVVFIVSDPGGAPEAVVKLTQHPRFNHRLQAEGGALDRWADHDGSFTVARPLFSADHAGRLVLAQSALAGQPFRAAAEPDPGGSVVQSGFRSVLELAAGSVQPTASGETGSALLALVKRFVSIYRPPTEVAFTLTASAERLSRHDLPTVFMHGDLGVWNLLVEPDGRIGILDWENADPAGIPLWDLFRFARTVGVFLADLRGVRYTPRVFTAQLLADGELRRALFEQIREYRRLVHVPASVVDDMFVLCWVQKAVREAATLPAPAWLESRGTRLLAAAIAHPLGFRD